MSAWGGSKPASIFTPETPQEAQARNAKAKTEQAAKEIEREANKLIGLIYQAIASHSGGSAPDYPGDKQYSVGGRWKPAVVNKAIEIWEGTEGVGYHTMTSVKRTGASRIGDTQTNFICKIIGPPTKPDHDAMKVKSDAAATPSLGKASQFQAERDRLDKAADAAKTDSGYNFLKGKADTAHNKMNSWLNKADSDRLFAEDKMARHNVHVTHDVAKAEV